MKLQAKKIAAGLGIVAVRLLAQFLAVAAWLGKVAENSPVLMDSAHASRAKLVPLPPYMGDGAAMVTGQTITIDGDVTVRGLRRSCQGAIHCKNSPLLVHFKPGRIAFKLRSLSPGRNLEALGNVPVRSADIRDNAGPQGSKDLRVGKDRRR